MITLSPETRKQIGKVDHELELLKELIERDIETSDSIDGPSNLQDKLSDDIYSIKDAITCNQEEQGWI